MAIILNDKQKNFLFDKHYVDAKVFDVAVEPGWKEYLMKNFSWELNKGQTPYGTRFLTLTDPKFSFYPEYSAELIFHGKDFEKILNLS